MALTVTHRSADPATLGTPLLIVPVSKGATLPPLDALDTALGGAIGRCRAAGDFTGARDEVAVLYPSTGKAERIMLVGLGDVEKVTASSLRRAAMIAGKRARVLGAPSAVLLFVPSTAPAVDAAKAGQSLAEGLPFGAWHYPDLKRPPETPKPKFESAEIVTATADAAFADGVARGVAIAEGQTLTRHLQMLPGNTCTPAFLGSRPRRWASGTALR